MLLALDPSLKGFGYCYKLNNELIYGTLKSTSLSCIRDFLVSLNSITYIVREGYAFGFHNSGFTKIVEIGGVIKLIASDKNVPVLDIAPTTLKSLITGNGKASKNDVINITSKVTQSVIIDDNISDAIALYLCGEAYIDYIQKMQIKFGSITVASVNKELRYILQTKGV